MLVVVVGLLGGKYIKRETNTNSCNWLDILCYCDEVHIDVGF